MRGLDWRGRGWSEMVILGKERRSVGLGVWRDKETVFGMDRSIEEFPAQSVIGVLGLVYIYIHTYGSSSRHVGVQFSERANALHFNTDRNILKTQRQLFTSLFPHW